MGRPIDRGAGRPSSAALLPGYAGRKGSSDQSDLCPAGCAFRATTPGDGDIMSALLGAATAAARSWTSLYTFQLPAELRDSRRAEIECDLWEHRQLARLLDEPAWETALAMLLRLALGMPADCSWRLDAGATVRNREMAPSVVAETGLSRWLLRCAYALIAVNAISAIGMTTRGAINAEPVWIAFGIMPFLASVGIIYGLSCSGSRQPLGILFVAGGCFVVTVIWYWLFAISIPISAGLIALSYSRGKRTGWRASGPHYSS